MRAAGAPRRFASYASNAADASLQCHITIVWACEFVATANMTHESPCSRTSRMVWTQIRPATSLWMNGCSCRPKSMYASEWSLVRPRRRQCPRQFQLPLSLRFVFRRTEYAQTQPFRRLRSARTSARRRIGPRIAPNLCVSMYSSEINFTRLAKRRFVCSQQLNSMHSNLIA